MNGQLSHEIEVNVSATEAWELYSTLKLAQLVEKEFTPIHKIELVEGDGGVGTVIKLVFTPGTTGFPGYKEKFVKIDNEKRIKETDVVEGGYLDIGFTLYRVRFEITEKSEESCLIKTTIEYQVKKEAAASASVVTIQPLAEIAEIAKIYLTKSKSISV